MVGFAVLPYGRVFMSSGPEQNRNRIPPIFSVGYDCVCCEDWCVVSALYVMIPFGRGHTLCILCP